jgi:hypothetical protein
MHILSMEHVCALRGGIMIFKKSIVNLGDTLCTVVKFNYNPPKKEKISAGTKPATTISIQSIGKEILYLTRTSSRLGSDSLEVNLSSWTYNYFYIIAEGVDDFEYTVNDAIYNSSTIKSNITERQLKNLLYTLCYEEYCKGNSEKTVDILSGNLKDSYLYKLTLNSFTARERERCKDSLFRAARNRKLKLGPKTWAVSRFMQGLLADKELMEDEFCIMQLLEVFERNKDRFIPLPADKYKRIGRRVEDNYNAFKVDKTTKVTADFSSLVFSKEKLNVSIRYEITGKVVINPRQAKAVGLSGNMFNAKIFREQTIIKDGDINIEKFKALLSKNTICLLEGLGIRDLLKILENGEYQYEGYTLVELNITKLPVLNKKYAGKGNSLDYILDCVYEQREAECRQKVLKYFLEKTCETAPNEGVSFSKEQLKLLRTYGYDPSGIYQGIDNQPVTAGAEKYQWRAFEFALKGFSNLPKVEDVIDKMKWKNRKLNGPETVMANYIKYLEGRKLLCSNDKLSKILEHQKKVIKAVTRTLAQIKLAKTLTGSWWSGLKLDSKDNYIYERENKTLVVKVFRKTVEV